ncbi:MAG: CoA transferase [Chloroflexi bacterium]|nr:CoA transferase [Chloroflexota bacterium]
MDRGPLGGFSALDLTDLKGQFAGKVLADLGADVIKVEPPDGDPVRRLGPFKDDLPALETSLRFAALNGGKRSVTLNVATVDGQHLLRQLAERVDVVLESFAPGYLDGLGLGPDELRGRNPALIVTSLTGFGQDGPRAGYLAPDIVGLAVGGLMSISGDPSLPPLKAPETQSYYYACVFAAYGVVLALLGRQKTKRGQTIDLSIQESIATQEHMIREAAFDGVAIVRNGSQHKHTAPANVFPCSDGHVYLFILSARDWERFLSLWPDHPGELDAVELKPPSNRRKHIDVVNPLVEQFTRRYRKAELTRLLQEAGVPCLPVNSPRDFLAEPQLAERQFFQPVSSSALGSYLAASFPVTFDGHRLPSAAPPPARGEHNPDVYGGWLGLNEAELELLYAKGVI